MLKARQNNFLQLFHVEWMDNTPPPTGGPAVQAVLVMTGRHGRPKTPWTQADFDFPGTHGRPPSGIRPKYSKRPLCGTNGASPSLLCSFDRPVCAGFITGRYLRETQSQIHSFKTSLILDFVPSKGRTRLVGNLINVLFSLERHLVRFTGIVLTKKSDKCIGATALVDHPPTAEELNIDT